MGLPWLLCWEETERGQGTAGSQLGGVLVEAQLLLQNTWDWTISKQSKLTLKVAEPGKSKVKAPAYSVSGEGLFLIDGASSVSLHGRRQKDLGSFLQPFHEGTNPIHGGRILMTESPPKDPTF